MEHLLIVEDTEILRTQLSGELGSDYTILEGKDYVQAMDQFQKFVPKVVTLDLSLSPGALGESGALSEGLRCLQWILAREPDTKVVVLTGNGDRETAQQALRFGAYGVYHKPVNPPELKLVILRAFQLSGLEEERRRLKETLERRGLGLEGIVGQCQAMQRVLSGIQMVAASDVPVLITGESGTGKELVARTIRSLSARAEGPFVPIKCGAIPKGLLDSELFGLEQGGGKVEHARKGTLFLDEPAELPHHLQLRLLRLLQGNKTSNGAGVEVEFDARLICAAKAELAQAVRAGDLLEDLFYRISVIPLELPPLRERGDDIMLLAHLFLRRFSQACNTKARGFGPAAIAVLEGHDWPGNVRELEARVQRGVIMCDGAQIDAKALGFTASDAPREETAHPNLTLREARDRVERTVIRQAIDQSRGNLAKASELLDVSRSTLYDLLKKHGLYHAGRGGES